MADPPSKSFNPFTTEGITPKFRKNKSEEIIEFIKEWTDGEKFAKAKELTEPRGLHKEEIKNFKRDFLDTSNEIANLYKMVKKIDRKKQKILLKEGSVVEVIRGNSVNNLSVIVPGHVNPITVNKKHLVPHKREDWTVSEVVAYGIKQLFAAQWGDCYYDVVRSMEKQKRTREEDSLGKLFEGVMCITSRTSKFCEMIDAIVDAAEKQGDSYIYLDFFADLKPHEEVEGDKATMLDIREEFVKEVSPKLVEGFDKVYIYVDDWKNSEICIRAWCIYEIYWAIRSNVEMKLVRPNRISEEFINQVSQEFEIDYYSYQDTATTVFTVFENFNLDLLESSSARDTKILKVQFESLFIQTKTTIPEVLAPRLLALFAELVIEILNSKLNEFHQLQQPTETDTLKIVHQLRICAYYLRKASFFDIAYGICYKARMIIFGLKLESNVQLLTLSELMAKVRMDEAKNQARMYLMYHDKKEADKNVMVKTITKATGLAELAIQYVGLAVTVRTYINIFLDLKQNKNGMGNLNAEERQFLFEHEVYIFNLLKDIAVGEIAKSKRMKYVNANVVLMKFETMRTFPASLKPKLIDYERGIRTRHKAVNGLIADSWYTKGIVSASLHRIDLKMTKRKDEPINDKVKIKYLERAITLMSRLINKDSYFMEKSLFLSLDYCKLLATTNHDNERFYIRLELVREDFKDIFKQMDKEEKEMESSKPLNDKRRAHLKLAFAKTLFDLGKYNMDMTEDRLVPQAVKHLEEALELVKDVEGHRAKAFRLNAKQFERPWRQKQAEHNSRIGVLDNRPGQSQVFKQKKFKDGFRF